tara:strand:- start:1976 stop:2092 length:117 start_codon:yes stop_codon:yes gene_type:complete
MGILYVVFGFPAICAFILALLGGFSAPDGTLDPGETQR